MVPLADVACVRDAAKQRPQFGRLRIKLSRGWEIRVCRVSFQSHDHGSVTLCSLKPGFFTQEDPNAQARVDGAGLSLEPLFQIIDELNERFGLALDQRDQLLSDQFEATWLADPEVSDQAQNNAYDNFRLVFDPRFLGTLVNRIRQRGHRPTGAR
jgi:hypothetical protein